MPPLEALRELLAELKTLGDDVAADGNAASVNLLGRLETALKRAAGLCGELADRDRRRDELLGELRALREQTEFAALLERVVDGAVRIARAERGFVLFVGTGGDFEFSVARNMDRAAVEGPEGEVSRNVVRRVIASGETVCLADASAAPEFADAQSVAALRLKSLLVAPILLGRRSVGVLYLERRSAPGAFNEATRLLVEEFAAHIGAALDTARTLGELARSRDELASVLSDGLPFPGVVGGSQAFRDALSMALRAATSELYVLILGESGSGKDLMARAVHTASPRRQGPFVVLNCAALPAQLMESELFGHVRGAFTGAEGPRRGLFASADGGTLFLDEIGEMPLAVQAKLLRALQSGEYRPVGSDHAAHADVRVVAATQKDLAEEARTGRFRADLYYRLNGVTVALPPLRERREDVLPLAERFLEETATAGGRPLAFDAPARIALLLHDYPGNVRELENIVRRAAVFTRDGTIGLDSLPADVAARALPASGALPTGSPRSSEELRCAVDAARAAAAACVERVFLVEALTRTGGNVSQAARETGVNRSQLQQMMKRQGLSAADFR